MEIRPGGIRTLKNHFRGLDLALRASFFKGEEDMSKIKRIGSGFCSKAFKYTLYWKELYMLIIFNPMLPYSILFFGDTSSAARYL